LHTVLVHAQRLSEDTGGAFDITAGPLTHLWRQARKEKRLPADYELREALARSGYRKLVLDDGYVRCRVEAMKLDAGGIAKGYAADQALAALRREGVGSALVAVSGDVAVSNAPPGQRGWRVRVQDEVITLSNAAVSTSGDEFQFLELDGVRYSHILDPRSGRPFNDPGIVSVIAHSGMEADSLATALSVLEPDTRKLNVRLVREQANMRLFDGRN
jgi:thiamine biosynthesis lipoprotein